MEDTDQPAKKQKSATKAAKTEVEPELIIKAEMSHPFGKFVLKQFGTHQLRDETPTRGKMF